MRQVAMLLALPASLLTLALSQTANAHELPWPYNLPRTVKYFPEDEVHIKRGLEAQYKLAQKTPVGMKKLGDDPGEKFFLDYWEFGEEPAQEDGIMGTDGDMRLPFLDEDEQYANDSLVLILKPAILRHKEHEGSDFGLFGRQLFGRHLFERAFQCPGGTTNCSSIGQSNYCCDSGETCVAEGSGGVGCCPAGQTCGATVAGCDTGAGYTPCSNGCCIPGSQCASMGCLFYGTQTVTTTLPVATVTTGTPSTTSTTTVTTTTNNPGTPVVVSTPFTTTVTISGSTVTTTVVSPTTIFVSSNSTSQSTCSTGFFSCPSSLGGGCCPNGQDCATGTHCPNLPSSTATASAAVLPTSVSDTSVSAAATTVVGVCPTGFYACSAVYLGGCCRTGRNCETTSCPPSDSTTYITGSEATIVSTGPSSADNTALPTTGNCASGWALCPASVGGGCCPSGYLCSSNCIATIAGVGNQTKEAPSGAAMQGFAWSLFILGTTAAVGMIFL